MIYKVELIRSEEGYAACCPELPGCWTQGDTEAEALQNVRQAIAEYQSIQPVDPNMKEVRFIDVSQSLLDFERAEYQCRRSAPEDVSRIGQGEKDLESCDHRGAPYAT